MKQVNFQEYSAVVSQYEHEILSELENGTAITINLDAEGNEVARCYDSGVTKDQKNNESSN